MDGLSHTKIIDKLIVHSLYFRYYRVERANYIVSVFLVTILVEMYKI